MPPRLSLPIDALLPRIVDALGSAPNLVLRAATGAGKTTRVPPALLRAGLGSGRIVMLEPRRVAARAAARRMAEENGWRLGKEVGYRIRFDRVESEATRILVVTEGMLVRMLQDDPFLDGIDILIFDELHERSLSSDLALAMARKVQLEARDDLRLIAMSATLDAGPLVEFLGGENRCAQVESEGRLFPVDVEYLPRPEARPLTTLVREGVERMLSATEGDVLVFLPGVGEIRRCQEVLEATAKKYRLLVAPLYGDLPADRQDAVLRPGSRRKVVLATNVAETSITIDGITAVVDSGLVRTLRFDPGHGLDRLELGKISHASAEQRKGRAGRQQAGHCLRLWTEHDHRSLPERDLPEVARVDLAGPVLELLAWGEQDPESFPWFEAPARASLERALRLLEDLGAIGTHRDGRTGSGLTTLGRDLARLPTHPRLARAILEGYRLGCLDDAALIAALLGERDVAFRPVGQRPVVAMRSASADPLDRLEGVRDFEHRGYGETALGPVDPGRSRHVLRIAEQSSSVARRRLRSRPAADPGDGTSDTSADRDTSLRRALLAAFPDRVARRREAGSRRATMVGGRGVRLAEMSAVTEAPFFVCLELDDRRHGGQRESLVRQAAAIEQEWLEPQTSTDEAYFDTERRRVLGHRVRRYRDLVLERLEIDPGAEAAEKTLLAAASAHIEEALALDTPPVASFLQRIRRLRIWMPDLELPSFDTEALSELLPMMVVGKRSFDELRRQPVLEILRGSADFAAMEALDRYAPEHLTVPSGSRIRLDYGNEADTADPAPPPILAVRIQELFGLTDTPRVAGGRVPVLLHLLAPNMRPQQVTRDLASFWANTYGEVRKELAGRYPKHAWPEDPLSAEPMRGAKKRRR